MDLNLIDLNDECENILNFFDPLLKKSSSSKNYQYNKNALNICPTLKKEEKVNEGIVTPINDSIIIIKNTKSIEELKTLIHILLNNNKAHTIYESRLMLIQNQINRKLKFNFLPAYTYISDFQNSYNALTFKMIVWYSNTNKVTFTCSGSNTTEHILEQVLCFLSTDSLTPNGDNKSINKNKNDDDKRSVPFFIDIENREIDQKRLYKTDEDTLYVLRVKDKRDVLYAKNSRFAAGDLQGLLKPTPLHRFYYVRDCVRSGKDVQLYLDQLSLSNSIYIFNESKEKVPFVYFSPLIQHIDDVISKFINRYSRFITSPREGYPLAPGAIPISYYTLSVIADTLNSLSLKLANIALSPEPGSLLYRPAIALVQAVKAAIVLSGYRDAETNELNSMVARLLHACRRDNMTDAREVIQISTQLKQATVDMLNMCSSLTEFRLEINGNSALANQEQEYLVDVGTMEPAVKEKNEGKELIIDKTGFFYLTIKSLHNISRQLDISTQSCYLQIDLCHGTKTLEIQRVPINTVAQHQNLSSFLEFDHQMRSSGDLQGGSVTKFKYVIDSCINFQTKICLLPLESYLTFSLVLPLTTSSLPVSAHPLFPSNDPLLGIGFSGGTNQLAPRSDLIGCSPVSTTFSVFDEHDTIRSGPRLITLLPNQRSTSNYDDVSATVLNPQYPLISTTLTPLLASESRERSVSNFHARPILLQFDLLHSVDRFYFPPDSLSVMQSNRTIFNTIMDQTCIERDLPLVTLSSESDELNSRTLLQPSVLADIKHALHKYECLLPLAEDEAETIWDKRCVLLQLLPLHLCIPLVIASSHSWAWTNAIHVYRFLDESSVPKRIKIKEKNSIGEIDVGNLGSHSLDINSWLFLLLPDFPDQRVRQTAVDYLSLLNVDMLVFYSPQLVILLLKFEAPAYLSSRVRFLESPLLILLLARAEENLRFAIHLLWSLSYWVHKSYTFFESNDTLVDHNEGCVPVVEKEETEMAGIVMDLMLSRRNDELAASFGLARHMFLRQLPPIAATLKRVKDDKVRRSGLRVQLTRLNNQLFLAKPDRQNPPIRLPIDCGFDWARLEPERCTYYSSKTVPLKLCFNDSLEVMDSEPNLAYLIYKSGDDLRQDQFCLQMIKLMDLLWLEENLDLNIVTFSCLPLAENEGIVEYLEDCETLRNIQNTQGISGTFRNQCIYEWLQRHNTQELDFKNAIKYFTRSCAGYCVATYILGICDRHNDNIMIKRSGHLIHIDFGKILGDSQMFGNVRRDRVPFVFTSDMAYVINQGNQLSSHFQGFIDLCCEAFNILRKNCRKLLNMTKIMEYAQIPGIPLNSTEFVRKTLSLDLNDTQATSLFTKLIKESLSSKFTQFNFFIHGLMKHTGDSSYSSKHIKYTTISHPIAHVNGNDGSIYNIPRIQYDLKSQAFSFTNNYFTLADTKEEIENVKVVGLQKIYQVDGKLYVYHCRVQYQRTRGPISVYRTYPEFLELRAKLRKRFPLADLPHLPPNLRFSSLAASISSTNVTETTSSTASHNNTKFASFYKGRVLVDQFCQAIFALAHEVGQSGPVITFFYPMVRDQRERYFDECPLKLSLQLDLTLNDQQSSAFLPSNFLTIADDARGVSSALRINESFGLPQIKLSLCCGSLNPTNTYDTLQILVIHCKNLLGRDGSLPDPYVKLCLEPDKAKITKRKTHIVFKASHPSFNDMFVYPLPLEQCRTKTLKISVGNFQRFKENEILGKLSIPLSNLEANKTLVSWFNLTVD
ncbi:phosphatidylinositol 4-phosphate 3-kinase C2 domain-containing subunit alpha-like isoform X2 [Gordionus sp. m RMFG-2023]|uniref:phosphatidylinositol 4-phosphate 3-kinase C2 domain-containing subunit alpha-like isoform X2 n=1 Tax=Gordionus sp. m RMFG-2023 TaxID=3053472 RepID=UPI0031FC226A